MAEPIEAFPLCWPVNRRRAGWREVARFSITLGKARDAIVREVKLLGGSGLIISSNLGVRRDGLPYANQRQPDDPGVAAYFTYKKQPMCFACDRWRKVEDNMQAIAKTIDALRGVARWGTGDMMEAAFTGFAALPPPSQTTARGWREVLGFQPNTRPLYSEVEAAYRRLRSSAHPDKGGTHERFMEVQSAFDRAHAELAP